MTQQYNFYHFANKHDTSTIVSISQIAFEFIEIISLIF